MKLTIELNGDPEETYELLVLAMRHDMSDRLDGIYYAIRDRLKHGDAVPQEMESFLEQLKENAYNRELYEFSP